MVPRIVPPSSFLLAIVVCMLLLLKLVQSPQELLLDPWLAEGTHPALVLEGEIFDATKATLFLRGMTFRVPAHALEPRFSLTVLSVAIVFLLPGKLGLSQQHHGVPHLRSKVIEVEIVSHHVLVREGSVIP